MDGDWVSGWQKISFSSSRQIAGRRAGEQGGERGQLMNVKARVATRQPLRLRRRGMHLSINREWALRGCGFVSRGSAKVQPRFGETI